MQRSMENIVWCKWTVGGVCNMRWSLIAIPTVDFPFAPNIDGISHMLLHMPMGQVAFWCYMSIIVFLHPSNTYIYCSFYFLFIKKIYQYCFNKMALILTTIRYKSISFSYLYVCWGWATNPTGDRRYKCSIESCWSMHFMTKVVYSLRP